MLRQGVKTGYALSMSPATWEILRSIAAEDGYVKQSMDGLISQEEEADLSE